MTAVTRSQCKAARALLGWKAESLAHEAGVAHSTISSFECGARMLRKRTRAKILRAFRAKGIRFIADRGVELRA